MPGTGILITVSILRDQACGLENECLPPGKRVPGCSYATHCEILSGRLAQKVFPNHAIGSRISATFRIFSVPILALVDADPFGLDILSVYKYGSRAMQHENDKLAARRIKWLGLWASELEQFVDSQWLVMVLKARK